MCYTDNSADHATVFINAQLSSLWENSAACARKLGQNPQQRSETATNRYAIALAKYFSGRPRSGTSLPQDFDVTFNKPSLQFVCNHDAILRLTIAEGHYIIASSENGRSTPVPGKSSGRMKELKDVEVEFRIPFQISGIQGGLSMIGASHKGIKLLSLDFSAPQLYFMSPSVDGSDHEAVTLYLKGYLKLLQRAGHHILFCLPEFNDAGLQYTVDFSSAIEKFDGVDTVFTIPTQKINDFLSASWLNAKILSGTSGAPSSNGAGLALAQYSSAWSSRNFGIHFNIDFSPPVVAALCSQEVLITFDIESVSFYEGRHPETDATPIQTFTKWKFSFLSTVELDQDQGGGSVLRFVLDQSSYHYMDHLSAFPGYDVDKDDHGLKSLLREFFVTEYLIRIEREELHILYDSNALFDFLDVSDLPEDAEIEVSSGDETDSGRDSTSHGSGGGRTAPNSSKVFVRQETTTTSDVGAFDVVNAISQAAVNLHFRLSWESSRAKKTAWSSMITKWTHSEVFEATFKPITVRLLSNERAIVVIHMETGYLKVGQDGFDASAESYSFTRWRLAFEVPLCKCHHNEIPGVDASWVSRFQESVAFKEHGKASDREFSHIYANFKDAEFVPTFSQFTGLFSNGVHRESIIKINALLALIREQYFPMLMAAGYHVVYTIPVWKGSNAPAGAFTDFHFRVSSETVITRKTLKGRSHSNDPVIVIIGTTTARPLPQLRHDFPLNWLICMGRAMRSGSACISHNLFLHPKLLELFSAVNAMTTMVPFFTGLNGPNWGLRLVPWAEDEDRKHVSSNFKLEENSCVADELRYGWQHEARWTYEQLGSSWSSHQKYTASCHTVNRLIIPTTYKHGLLDIQIEGRVELRTGYGVGKSDSWVARAAMNWSSNLLVRTHQGCLYVSVDSARPIYEAKVVEGIHNDHKICDPEELLKKHFVKAPDLAAVAALFRQFEEPWKSSYPGEGAFNLAHPAFNKRGDLLFELRPFVPRGAPPVFRPRPQRHLTLKQSFGPSDFVLPRGRPGKYS
ncbi:hypothetical protein BDY19DRAFT_903047 [Irpex rosettiformis]|uniref:Uncharacterized protein n=1 Tax=Irpex rosettiformis TaxID=378272 RepID=A0ACB8UG14_9APHY|nr:hypothetical protein BDY19DRAFT_903047 [Irpex rosettiformis]